MFTGIVEEVGRVDSFIRQGNSARLVVKAKIVPEDIKLGDSVSIDGVCQTVVSFDSESFAVDTLAESLKKTTLGSLLPGSPVNLERALRADSRMGGHFVQGHVSCTVRILELRKDGNNAYLTVEIPDEHLYCCVPEGSIALDGISLTIACLKGNALSVNIIPATLKATGLWHKKAGDFMNLETDILGRYAEKILSAAIKGKKTSGLSLERLEELGY